MVPPAEPMTYDDVTEVYRKEQRSKSMTEVRRDFYPALRECLDRLKRDNEREIAVDPFSPKSMSLSNQLKKISEKADQIFEFRMEKLLLTALRSSGGGKVDVSRLTEEEKELYDNVLGLLQQGRAAGARKEEVRMVADPEEPSLPKPAVERNMEEVSDVPAPASAEVTVAVKEPDTPPTPAVQAEAKIAMDRDKTAPPLTMNPQDEYMLLRILEDIPPFAGPDRNYVLQREDMVTLPSSIAKALIGKKKAVGVQVPGVRA